MRYANGETVHAAQFFQTGHTVNITVLNLATDAALSTTTGVATESAVVDGLYIWPSSDLVTPPASYTEVAVVFEDATSGLQKVSKIALRGYVDNLDAAISSLNDLSIADVQTALTNQGYTTVRAALLDNLDQALSTTETTILAAIAALNDIAVADILAATLGSGESVDVALSRLDNIDVDITTIDTNLTAVDELLRGGRSIDFVGNDALGWQRVERDTSDVEVARYNLFDESGARITGTVSAFLLAQKMIAREVKL